MQKNKNYIMKLCLSAIMSAIYVGLDYLAVTVSAPFGGNLKIALNGLPVIIIAAFFGPLWAAATGFVGAFIGQMITYGFSATTLLWVLPAVIRGLSVGFMFKVFKNSFKLSHVITITSISSVIVTVFNTFAMLVEQKIYGYYNSYLAIFVAIPTRLITGILTAVVMSLMLPTIIDSLKNIVNKYTK